MSRFAAVCCVTLLFLASCGVPLDSDSESNENEPSGGSAAIGDGDTSSGGGHSGTGATTGNGGVLVGTGGAGAGGTEPTGPVAELFEHCDYGGWAVSLGLGDYTTDDLVALGALDNDASSLQVAPGFEVILFDGDNFSGNSVTITADTPCVVAHSFNDLTSSARVQAVSAGTGGAAGTGGSDGTGGTNGTGGSDGIGGAGITSCQPAFETACKPTINFDNQHSDGGGALFDDLFPDIVSEMQDITCTVCSILYRSPDEIPQNKRHSTVNVTIDAHNGVAYASGNSITMSVNHLSNYTNPASAYVEYRGVLVHETVHLYQHYGNGGTGEGMADCVRIRVGLYQPGRCNTGGSWRDAYTTSGCFYSWLTGPSVYHSIAHTAFDPDMPYKINAALSGTSGEGAYTAVSSLLESTFGQDVDALWDAYQDDL